MSSGNARAPLVVNVPSPAEDRPAWKKVGIVTAVGFVVGVAWPRVAGVRLGPSVPESPSAAVSAPASIADAPLPTASMTTTASAATVGAAPSAAAPPPTPAPSPAQARAVTVGHGTVVSCKTADGALKKAADCGTLGGLDAAVVPHLKRMADCPSATDDARSRVALRVDFARNSLDVDAPRGNLSDALVACARTQLGGTSLAGITHDQPRYTVVYPLTWTSHAAADVAPVRPSSEGADTAVQVQWDVAIVRDAPKTGKVVARLQRGTALRVGAMKDGWYPVKYGDGFASEGWVYRAAIGR